MRRPWLWALYLGLAPVGVLCGNRYFVQCVPGFFGPECAQVCAECGDLRECNDGVTGTGECVCRYGKWADCQEESPLVNACSKAERI